jgi:hypothetical protein
MKTLVSIILIPCTILFSEIYEIKQIHEIHIHLHQDQLVIFDIDNTLMEPIQQLGSDQWFRYRIKEHQNKGMDYASALERTLPEWTAIQNITRVKPVEQNTAKCVHELQTKKYSVMGLTTRGLGIATRTVEQLMTIGIDLSITAPATEEKFFMNDGGVLFRKGILFTAGTHKGKALKKFLNLIKFQPKSMLFINDKMENLKEVEMMCTEEHIPFTGLRYGFLDEKIKKFRKDLVDVQFDHFGHILSDEAAEAILERASVLKSKNLKP